MVVTRDLVICLFSVVSEQEKRQESSFFYYSAEIRKQINPKTYNDPSQTHTHTRARARTTNKKIVEGNSHTSDMQNSYS